MSHLVTMYTTYSSSVLFFSVVWSSMNDWITIIHRRNTDTFKVRTNVIIHILKDVIIYLLYFSIIKYIFSSFLAKARYQNTHCSIIFRRSIMFNFDRRFCTRVYDIDCLKTIVDSTLDNCLFVSLVHCRCWTSS